MLLAVVGCASKVQFEKTKDISIADEFNEIVGGPTSAQKVRVEVSAANAPVDVWVILAKDLDEKAEQDVAARRPPASILKHTLNTQQATLDVDIPAKQDFHVWVTVVKKSTPVTVKINSL
jgi:hypothetical protein